MCGCEFKSRNALFEHLKTACLPAVATLTVPSDQLAEKPRLSVLVGFVGDTWYGTKMNGPSCEIVRPSVAAAVLAAAQRAWGPVVTAANAEAVRTERGASAAANVVLLTMLRGDAGASCETDADKLRRELPPSITLLAGPRLAPPAKQGEELFKLVRLQVYTCAVPYSALLPGPASLESQQPDTALESQQQEQQYEQPQQAQAPMGSLPACHGSCIEMRSGSGSACHGSCVWLAGLPPGSAASDVRQLLQAVGMDRYVKGVVIKEGSRLDGGDGGLGATAQTATLMATLTIVAPPNAPASEVPDTAPCAAVLEALDGYMWRGATLQALDGAEAEAKHAVHGRISFVLARLAAAKCFHNFIQTKGGVSASSAARRLQLSSANITEDLRAQKGSRPEGAWRTGDWVQIHLGAREFGAQQLRRMTGVLVALVRGVEGDDYLQRCFDPRQQVATPLAPSESQRLVAFSFERDIAADYLPLPLSWAPTTASSQAPSSPASPAPAPLPPAPRPPLMPAPPEATRAAWYWPHAEVGCMFEGAAAASKPAAKQAPNPDLVRAGKAYFLAKVRGTSKNAPLVSSLEALSAQHDARRRHDELVARVCARITCQDGAAAAAWSEFVASLQAGDATRSVDDARLRAAAARGDLVLIHECIGHRSARVDGQDEYGRTALFLAAEHGHADAVRELLALGARATLTANGGWLPAAAAVASGHVELAASLQAACEATEHRSFAQLQPLLRKALLAHKAVVLRPSARDGEMLEIPTGHVPIVTTLMPASLAPHPGAGTLVLETALPPACLDAIVQLWRALPVAPKDKPSPIDRSYYADVDGWLCAALDSALVAVGLMPEPAAASDGDARAADGVQPDVQHSHSQHDPRRGGNGDGGGSGDGGDGGAGLAAAAAGKAAAPAARLTPLTAHELKHQQPPATALELKHQQPPTPRQPPPLDYRPCGLAAKYGELGRLQQLRVEGAAWNEEVGQAAAWAGHLHVLKWALRNGCPWDWRVVVGAATLGGRAEVLRWAAEEEAREAERRSGHLPSFIESECRTRAEYQAWVASMPAGMPPLAPPASASSPSPAPALSPSSSPSPSPSPALSSVSSVPVRKPAIDDDATTMSALYEGQPARSAAPLRYGTLPLMRFLHYPSPGGSLPAHVDLPRVLIPEGAVNTHPVLPRQVEGGVRTTHSFLLYLTDCEHGGETLLLEAKPGDAKLAAAGDVPPVGRPLRTPAIASDGL